MLPPLWQKISMLNPVVYLISGFRWSFYGNADVKVEISLIMISVFLLVCMLIVRRIFKTGYRLKP
jgi:ABC-2 type transport system permease protein